MAANAPWNPQEEGFKEICGLLEKQISHSSSADKSQIWQQLQHYSQLADFNNYLVFILARAEVQDNFHLTALEQEFLFPGVLMNKVRGYFTSKDVSGRFRPFEDTCFFRKRRGQL